MRIFAVISLLLSIIIVLLYEKKAGKKTELNIETVESGRIRIMVSDKKVCFPCFLRYEFSIENRFTGDVCGGKFLLGKGFATKGMNKTDIVLKDMFPGNYRIIIKNKYNQFKSSMLIIPETYSVEMTKGMASLLDLDGNIYSPSKSGFDMSEIFAIREYKEGDSIKGVHWKLSNKLDTLLIKEGSFPIKNSVLILMETGFNMEGELLKQRASETVAAVLSISESLIDKGIGHHISWWDNESSIMKFYEVSGIENLKNSMADMLSSPFSPSGEVAKKKYYENIGEEKFSRIAYVDGKVKKIEDLFN